MFYHDELELVNVRMKITRYVYVIYGTVKNQRNAWHWRVYACDLHVALKVLNMLSENLEEKSALQMQSTFYHNLTIYWLKIQEKWQILLHI